MTLATLVNRLKAEGTIEQIRVNRYQVNNTPRARGLCVDRSHLYTLTQIHDIFTVRVSGGDYRFRLPTASRLEDLWDGPSEPAPAPRRLRTISRQNYHSSGYGTSRDGLERALARIAPDEDGVRRSYGVEWEINALTAEQEDALASLLDTLPAHFTERDASLSSSGVEIIFLPLGKEKMIETWTKLQTFCRENDIGMSGTGAHLTYGVSNARCTHDDLQIRLNRIALSVKAASTQGAIKRVFGRDFTGYARLPESTTMSSHSNAWNASRGTSAYELRLCNWQGNIEKIIEFMRQTEFVFHRTFTAQDFINIFNVMGSDASGV